MESHVKKDRQTDSWRVREVQVSMGQKRLHVFTMGILVC